MTGKPLFAILITAIHFLNSLIYPSKFSIFTYVPAFIIVSYPPYSSYLDFNFECFSRYNPTVISSKEVLCSLFIKSSAIVKNTFHILFENSSKVNFDSYIKSGFLKSIETRFASQMSLYEFIFFIVSINSFSKAVIFLSLF